jgi:hypothetical protein
MDIERVPAALQERLGIAATAGLLQLLDSTHREWRGDVIAASSDRFERRLVEEIATVRVQIAQVEASIRRDMAETASSIRRDMATMGAEIRQDMATMGAEIRQDMATMGAGIRQDMATMGAGIRQDMGTMGAGIRQDMASGRVELFKWCFLFWIGQVVAVAGIMGVLLRAFRP